MTYITSCDDNYVKNDIHEVRLKQTQCYTRSKQQHDHILEIGASSLLVVPFGKPSLVYQ